MKQIFITGGTGYMGSRLIKLLLKKGYSVKALVRKGSEKKLPAGCDYVTGNAFDASSFVLAVPAHAIFIQLLGVAHPSPKKKEQFKTTDLPSTRASANDCCFNHSHLADDRIIRLFNGSFTYIQH